MGMVRCDNGHWYDNTKFSSCPHCGVNLKTSNQSCEMTVSYSTEGDGDSKTIHYQTRTDGLGGDPVAGWLVCIKGSERGRDYRIFRGFNFIGRNAQLSIDVEGDQSISREKHAAIVYEPYKNEMYIVPIGGNVTYINGELLGDTKKIFTNDVVTIGNSEFVFVAFCLGDRKWKELEY